MTITKNINEYRSRSEKEHILYEDSFIDLTVDSKIYLKGIRQNYTGASNSDGNKYPSPPGGKPGYGAAHEYYKVYIGKFDYPVGNDYVQFMGTGFLIDENDYKNDPAYQDYIIESAVLNLYSLNDSVNTTDLGYSNYSLRMIKFPSAFNSEELTYNNYQSWIDNGEMSYAPAEALENQEQFDNRIYENDREDNKRFDITNAVSAWQQGFVLGEQAIEIKTDHNENHFASHYHEDISKRPYIEVTGKSAEIDPIHIDDTNVNLRAFTSNDNKGNIHSLFVTIDGLTANGAIVDYEIIKVSDESVVASGTTTEATSTNEYPFYLHGMTNVNNYFKLESNYQSSEMIPLDKFQKNTLYKVRVKAYGDVLNPDTGEVSYMETDYIDEDDAHSTIVTIRKAIDVMLKHIIRL